MKPGDLGQHIRALREQKELGVRELARRAGLSAGSILAIEKGSSSPTLANLHKILKAMDTDFSEFFHQPAEGKNLPVFRQGDMKQIEDAHRIYRMVFPKRTDIQFEIFRETILPGDPDSEWETHDFDMGGILLSGRNGELEIETEGRWDLKAGDGFYITAGQTHRLNNRGDKPLELVTVSYPAKY